MVKRLFRAVSRAGKNGIMKPFAFSAFFAWHIHPQPENLVLFLHTFKYQALQQCLHRDKVYSTKYKGVWGKVRQVARRKPTRRTYVNCPTCQAKQSHSYFTQCNSNRLILYPHFRLVRLLSSRTLTLMVCQLWAYCLYA